MNSRNARGNDFISRSAKTTNLNHARETRPTIDSIGSGNWTRPAGVLEHLIPPHVFAESFGEQRVFWCAGAVADKRQGDKRQEHGYSSGEGDSILAPYW